MHREGRISFSPCHCVSIFARLNRPVESELSASRKGSQDPIDIAAVGYQHANKEYPDRDDRAQGDAFKQFTALPRTRPSKHIEDHRIRLVEHDCLHHDANGLANRNPLWTRSLVGYDVK